MLDFLTVSAMLLVAGTGWAVYAMCKRIFDILLEPDDDDE